MGECPRLVNIFDALNTLTRFTPREQKKEKKRSEDSGLSTPCMSGSPFIARVSASVVRRKVSGESGQP
eukprot:scaffold97418_cov29-Tisochrysis_lutea.AAC.1